MKRNLIKTDNYLLVVDESVKEINNGEYFLLGSHINKWAGTGIRHMTDLSVKIIAHLPMNGAPYLDGVNVLPSNWRDSGEEESVEQLAQKEWGNVHRAGVLGFIDGCKKTREKFLYTEEHVFGFLTYYNSINFNKPEYRYKHPSMDGSQREYNRSIDRKILAEYIKSLQQPKYPIAFECEMELVYYPANMPKEGEERPPYRPKTFINSEGRTEWVGKYIYN